jgi:hypothetical protein
VPDHGVSLVAVTWAAQAAVVTVVGTALAAGLRWIREVNRRLARIESRLKVRSHRR